MTEIDTDALNTFATTVLGNPYIPHKPTMKQAQFLVAKEREVFFGGAARGGKTWALLMKALQYVEVPGYHALLLRRTVKELEKAESLIPTAHEWLSPTDAKWREQKKSWTFPSGATLEFGYCENVKDVMQYQSAAYELIGFDELTHFTEFQYTYLFSRQSRPKDSRIPLQMVSASNPPLTFPGITVNEWPEHRFIPPERDIPDYPEVLEFYIKTMRESSRRFIPARLEDNEHVDQMTYDTSLKRMGEVEYAQLRYGNWYVRNEGSVFKTHKLKLAGPSPHPVHSLRFWDLAATDPKDANDPDYTVGLHLTQTKDGMVWVKDVVRFREDAGAEEGAMAHIASTDGIATSVRVEQEPGASGKIVVKHIAKALIGYDFQGMPSSRSKATRAKPVAAAVANGLIQIDAYDASGRMKDWVKPFLDELTAFPSGAHDDQVDAFSGAFNCLVGGSSADRFDETHTGRM